MTDKFEGEFQSVDFLLGSDFETRGVDAFTLSWVKSERQMRRLFTYVIYQSAAFGKNDVVDLRKVLASNRNIYFQHFEDGLGLLMNRSIADLVGGDYIRLNSEIQKAVPYRHKILHGQLTLNSLGRAELCNLATDIKSWCRNLARGAKEYIGYDGFEGNSFRKSLLLDISTKLKRNIVNLQAYEDFLAELDGRQKAKRAKP